MSEDALAFRPPRPTIPQPNCRIYLYVLTFQIHAPTHLQDLEHKVPFAHDACVTTAAVLPEDPISFPSKNLAQTARADAPIACKKRERINMHTSAHMRMHANGQSASHAPPRRKYPADEKAPTRGASGGEGQSKAWTSDLLMSRS